MEWRAGNIFKTTQILKEIKAGLIYKTWEQSTSSEPVSEDR